MIIIRKKLNYGYHALASLLFWSQIVDRETNDTNLYLNLNLN